MTNRKAESDIASQKRRKEATPEESSTPCMLSTNTAVSGSTARGG
jgi:hypothetical protein